MVVVFVFTAIGLAILGIPLWLLLALLDGLLSFIPNFGPLIALIPAVLVGLIQGPQTALWVVGFYVLIQFVESNFFTTLIQQKMINMPPALIISAQMILGALTGIWGLVLSTPITNCWRLSSGRVFTMETIKDASLRDGNHQFTLLRSLHT